MKGIVMLKLNCVRRTFAATFLVLSADVSTLSGQESQAGQTNQGASSQNSELFIQPAQKNQEPKKDPLWSDGLKIGAMLRFRPEMKYNYDFDRSKNDNSEFVGQKIQFWIEKDFNEQIKAKITFQDARVWGAETGSASGLNTANDSTKQSTDIREAWVDVKNLIGPVSLQSGRQILRYGEERLVGGLDWTNVGRSFDGFRFKYDTKELSSHAWVMVIGEQDSDIAGNSSSLGKKNTYQAQYNCPTGSATCKLSPNASRRESGDAYFAGFYNTYKPSEILNVDLYYIGLQKKWIPTNNGSILSVSNPDPYPRDSRWDILHTFGMRITNRTQKDRKSTQAWDYSLEYAVQTGSTGKTVRPGWDNGDNSVSVRDPITGTVRSESIYKEKQKYDAFAFALDFGYTISQFRFGVEYDVGSGDPNRKDGSVSTFSNLFHSNHIYYGEADQVSWVNMIGKSANLTWESEEWGKFRIAYWLVDKHKRQDGWYDITGNLKEGASTESISNNHYASGIPATKDGLGDNRGVGLLGTNLFREIDFTYSIKHKSVAWALGLSWIYAGDAVGRKVNDVTVAYNSSSFLPQAQFAYLMMTYTL